MDSKGNREETTQKVRLLLDGIKRSLEKHMNAIRDTQAQVSLTDTKGDRVLTLVIGLYRRDLFSDLSILAILSDVTQVLETATGGSSELESKVAEVETELQKRKKGLDWIDNLLSHVPNTGNDEP